MKRTGDILLKTLVKVLVMGSVDDFSTDMPSSSQPLELVGSVLKVITVLVSVSGKFLFFP